MIANGIAFTVGMVAAVDLDDEALLAADEVDDVGSYGGLTDELQAEDLTGAQPIPELALGIG